MITKQHDSTMGTDLFAGSQRDVAGRMASMATELNNKRQMKVICAAGHLPKELGRLVAGYSAIDVDVVRPVFGGVSTRVREIIAFADDNWKVKLLGQLACDPELTLKLNMVRDGSGIYGMRISACAYELSPAEMCAFLTHGPTCREIEICAKQLGDEINESRCIIGWTHDRSTRYVADLMVAVRIAICDALTR